MHDHTFTFDTPVPAGRVVFRFVNEGGVAHSASLVPLPEDLLSLEEQLLGDERREVPNFAEVHARGPGEEGTFAVNLEPGRRYGLVCFLRDDDDVPHARLGMHAEFRAGGPDAPPPDHDPADPQEATP